VSVPTIDGAGIASVANNTACRITIPFPEPMDLHRHLPIGDRFNAVMAIDAGGQGIANADCKMNA
jgi:hypothetical protein